jgi:MFS family permease
MTQAGYRLGAILAGAGALFLAEVLDWSWVYAVMAALVIVGMAAAIFAPDPEKRTPALADTHATRGLRAMVIDPFIEFFQRNTIATPIYPCCVIQITQERSSLYSLRLWHLVGHFCLLQAGGSLR